MVLCRGGRGTGTAVPGKSVFPGSLSPHCLSRGLSPESQSPGCLSPRFLSPSLSPVPHFQFFSPRPCPRSPIFQICVPVPVPGPRFSKILSPSLSPSQILHKFCPRPCPQPVPDKFWPVANLTSFLSRIKFFCMRLICDFTKNETGQNMN